MLLQPDETSSLSYRVLFMAAHLQPAFIYFTVITLCEVCGNGRNVRSSGDIPIALVTAAILAMAFMGFSGIV